MTGCLVLSLLGSREQEASQLLAMGATAHYAIAYAGLFAIPLAGNRALIAKLPPWLRVTALAGLLSSLIALVIAVYPIVEVQSRGLYAAKICGIVLASNVVGLSIYRLGRRS